MADDEQGKSPQENAPESADPQESGGPATPESTTPPPEPAAAPTAEVTKDAKTMALLCHVLAIFTGFLGPLILWIIKKDENAFIDYHGKEALNFQITVLIAAIVSGVLTIVCVGFFLLAAVGIGNIVFCIIASLKANAGELYRYPVSIRLVK